MSQGWGTHVHRVHRENSEEFLITIAYAFRWSTALESSGFEMCVIANPVPQPAGNQGEFWKASIQARAKRGTLEVPDELKQIVEENHVDVACFELDDPATLVTKVQSLGWTMVHGA